MRSRIERLNTRPSAMSAWSSERSSSSVGILSLPVMAISPIAGALVDRDDEDVRAAAPDRDVVEQPRLVERAQRARAVERRVEALARAHRQVGQDRAEIDPLVALDDDLGHGEGRGGGSLLRARRAGRDDDREGAPDERRDGERGPEREPPAEPGDQPSNRPMSL